MLHEIVARPSLRLRALQWCNRAVLFASTLFLGEWALFGVFRCPFVVPFVSCQNCPVITCPGQAARMFWGFWGVWLAVAALFVVSLHPDNPQWIIWSAASVVTGDWVASKRKLCDRLLGALVGVPVGVLLGVLLPQVPLVGLLLSVITCATVLVLRRYVVSFGVRCACAACAIVIAHHALSVASERFFNVALGGLIGAMFVLALHLLSGNKLSEPRQ